MKKNLKIVPAVLPMPVVLIATYNEDGSVDVMNAAWVTAYDFKQIKLNISEEHKTTENIRRTRSFTLAMADFNHMSEADYVGMVSGKRVKDKFAKTGLKSSKGEMVNAPVLEGFPLIMECELEDFDFEYGVVGNIKRLAVDEEYIDENGKIDVEKMKILCFNPLDNSYHVLGEKVGQAYFEGKKIK